MDQYIRDKGWESAFPPEAVKLMSQALERSWSHVLAHGASFDASEEAAIRSGVGRFIVDAAKAGVLGEGALSRGALNRLSAASATKEGMDA